MTTMVRGYIMKMSIRINYTEEQLADNKHC